MKKIVGAAVLAASYAMGSAEAADQKNKPQSTQATTAAQTAAQIAAQPSMPRPDFVVVLTPDGSMILDNVGTADFTGKVGVDYTCKVLTGGAIAVSPSTGGGISSGAPRATCGGPFTDGKGHSDFDSFPKGHGVKPNAPIEPPAGTSMYEDGRIVIHLKMPKGTYEMTATADPGNKVAESNETNNSAGPLTVTVK